jgi:glycerol-3-phosphate dehydrogenase (NAD(P)+)
MKMKRVSFLGAGSWGTALAILCANNGHKVTLWSKLESEIDMLRENREHVDRLPGVKLPDSIMIESNLETACKNQDIIVCSVASPFVRSTAQEAKPFIKDNQIIVNVGKGIEDETLMTLCEVLSDELPTADVCVLSGPSHAEEVSKGAPTTVVVGAKTQKTAMFVQDVFMGNNFRVYTSPDMIGIELGGALKNVIALAAGILDGMGMGDNTKAALMTRGIAEISRLGIELGGKMETFCGLSGIGDLIVTCTSTHSRNHNCGYLLGQGKTLAEAKEEIKQVIEGVNCAKAAMALANKYHVTMPIVEQINAMLFEDKPAKLAMKDLLERDKASEYKTLTWQ